MRLPTAERLFDRVVRTGLSLVADHIQQLGADRVRAMAAAFDVSHACIRQLDGTIMVWSKGNERLYGWSREESVGKTTHSLLRTVFPKSVRKIEAELLERGTWQGELQHVTKAGRPIWVASHWELQRGEDGSAVSVIETNNDISDRKRADATSRHLALIVESSDDAIISKDVDGNVTSWNPGAERLFGYSAAEVLGKKMRQLFPPELEEEEHAIMDRLRRGERIEHYETVRVAKSGRRLLVSLKVSAVLDASGKVIGASKIARDITDQKGLEAAVRESEERQRLAVEAGEIGLWFFNAQTKEWHYSPRCKEILDFGAESEMPVAESIFPRIHEEDLRKIRAAFDVSLETGAVFEDDFRVLTRTAGVRWVHSKGRPQLAGDGGVIGIHGALVDTTLRKQAEEKLTQVNEQLELFAYAIAHDLQEPLRTIALSVQLAQLRLRNEMDEQSTAFLNGAVESARQMESMVRDLLAYSRVLREDEAQRTISDASVVFKHALKNLATGIAETRAQIICGELPKVQMPQAHLLQIFQNLIDNSIKHRGADPPCIEISASCKAGMCQFSIADNGLGIEPQYQQRVFDVFKRLRKSEVPGTGVGLALCKRTVEHYGGTIWIQSDGQTGTTFYFTIPSA